MLSRRYFLAALPLCAAACSNQPEPPRYYTPLRYDYLLPLRLNVSSLKVEDQRREQPDDLGTQSPVTPISALMQMAHDRLQADGSAGQAVFTIEDASIHSGGGGLHGTMKVRLDVTTTNGAPAAFAEASVARAITGVENRQDALYDLTKQMMDDMNVELEHQLRRSLKDWLLPAGDQTAPVQENPL